MMSNASGSRGERVVTRLGRSAARLNVTGAGLTVTAAVLGLATAVLSFAAVNLNGDVHDRNVRIAELQRDVDESAANFEVAQDTIARLKEENSELRVLVPPAIDPNEAHEIRAGGTVTLAQDGDSIDLNSTLPNFAARSDSYPVDSLRYQDGYLRGGYGMSIFELAQDHAGYKTCAVATGYHREDRYEPHLLESDRVCFRLASGLYAKVVVTQYSETAVDVAVTVWD